jgi:hypothetical protein
MPYLTKAQKARVAIRVIKTTVDALALRGYYKPSGRSGQTLAEGLQNLSPEIYGSMNDPRILELKGLEYVIERLPRGIEQYARIILTAEEEFENTSFEKIIPPKRRRTSYRVSEKEICFVITRGLSEIYDILTHITFLNIEAQKIYGQMKDKTGNITGSWEEFEATVVENAKLSGGDLDKALWNLSIILGRAFHETKESFESLEKYSTGVKDNNVLFQIIYGLGKRIDREKTSKENELVVSFTPSLKDLIGSQSYSEKWARDIKMKICELGLQDRPLHIISANMHSVVNLLYGHAAIQTKKKSESSFDIYKFIPQIREKHKKVRTYALKHGLYELPDASGTHIDCQIIDTALLQPSKLHPDISIEKSKKKDEKPVILVMDYAFGAQAFDAMDELLDPFASSDSATRLKVSSISIMGKAGILPGKKGDVMLATAHVLEGSSDNYMVDNDLAKGDFDSSIDVYVGPMVTVVGTSLQNRDVLRRFQSSSWKAVGLEMEGGHYQKAISSAVIRDHIPSNVKIRYAYYASDNPLVSGQTLASGSIGEEGVKPTYVITRVILEKILSGS